LPLHTFQSGGGSEVVDLVRDVRTADLTPPVESLKSWDCWRGDAPQTFRLCDVWGMALLSRIPRFPILGILEIGGIDDEEPKSGTLRKGRGGTAASPGLAASTHAK